MPLRREGPPAFQPSVSCISVFVGLRGSAAELGLPKRQYWWFRENDHDEVKPC